MNENSAYKRFEIVDLKYQVIDRHHKGGELKIGDDVYIDFGVTIDITGNVTLEDNVVLSEGVMVLTHSHDLNEPMSDNKQIFNLIIKKGAWVGPRSIINCKYVGENAYIYPGSVVFDDVPDNHYAIGNPAIVKEKS